MRSGVNCSHYSQLFPGPWLGKPKHQSGGFPLRRPPVLLQFLIVPCVSPWFQSFLHPLNTVLLSWSDKILGVIANLRTIHFYNRIYNQPRTLILDQKNRANFGWFMKKQQSIIALIGTSLYTSLPCHPSMHWNLIFTSFNQSRLLGHHLGIGILCGVQDRSAAGRNRSITIGKTVITKKNAQSELLDLN